jgi:transcriptional regulator with XRE-family HTH domain
MLHIRKNVLGVTQSEMAVIANTRQATISRWENGGLEPSRDQLALIREEAIRRGLGWDDKWFFCAPPSAEAA